MNTKKILNEFGFDESKCKIVSFGTGLINSTWKIESSTSKDGYILQRINKNVFKHPEDICSNIDLISEYLKINFPEYLFTHPIKTIEQKLNFVVDDGEYYRMFDYVKNSKTINIVETPEQAYEAAKQFAKFTTTLSRLDSSRLKTTIPDFHNLQLRFEQFKNAIAEYTPASYNRLTTANNEIEFIFANKNIVDDYLKIIQSKKFKLRVTHHDTKISNVLFDQNNNGLCVIDLDTVMPGYFISDVGDMCRTYLSECNEEEKDVTKVEVRANYFKAIADGYLSEMGNELSDYEKEMFVYAGEFIIYMQAIRFLTDYIRGDIYFHINYPEQNFVRAKNQIKLLQSYQREKKNLMKIIRVNE